MSLFQDVLAALQPMLTQLTSVAQEHPVHVSIEVVLAVFIAYIFLVKQSYDPAKRFVRIEPQCAVGGLPRAARPGLQFSP